MKKLLATMIFSLIFISLAHSFTLSNFNTPESMLVDPEDGSYYVSNVNGASTAKDGNGYISKISSSGNIVIQKYIGGKKNELLLNAPKGMVIVGKNIFVTDIDTVKGFNKETTKPSVLVDLSKTGAAFLNDIAVDGQGFLYVSDMMTNTIYKIDTNNNFNAKILKTGKELGGPNGLIINPKTKNLIVVTMGTGQVLEIDRANRIHILKRGLTGLDGVDYDNDGNLYVSSFEKGEIYKIGYFGRGAISTFMTGLTSPADISCDRSKKELLIPSFKGNTVLTVPLAKKPITKSKLAPKK